MKIGTHDGAFHADEVTACAILEKIFPSCEIVRTRDEQELAKCDILVDVGMTYVPIQGKFDHHQNSNYYFDEAKKHEMSSAGMVYKYYGREFIRTYTALSTQTGCGEFVEEISAGQSRVDDQENYIFYRFYENFICSIDEIDIGKTKGSPNSISALIAQMNRDTNDYDVQDQQFLAAMNFCRVCINIVISRIIFGVKCAKTDAEIITNAYNARNGKPYLIIHSKCHEWWNYTHSYVKKGINWIIMPNNNMWRVRCLDKRAKPLKSESFLRSVLGNSLDFVHKDRFVAGTTTLESAIRLAEICAN